MTMDEAKRREPMTAAHIAGLIHVARVALDAWDWMHRPGRSMQPAGYTEADAIVRLGEEVIALRDDLARLRAEHAAAFDAARREGAEGMREAAVAMIGRRITAWDDDADECGDEDAATRWEEATAIRDAIRALPLDAPGGGS